MSAMVWVEESPRQGFERIVQPGTVGREGCDVILPDPDVSRRHAAVRLLDNGVAVEDLGSTNGTFVNGVRLEAPKRLSPGDVVRVGETDLRYEG